VQTQSWLAPSASSREGRPLQTPFGSLRPRRRRRQRLHHDRLDGPPPPAPYKIVDTFLVVFFAAAQPLLGQTIASASSSRNNNRRWILHVVFDGQVLPLLAVVEFLMLRPQGLVRPKSPQITESGSPLSSTHRFSSSLDLSLLLIALAASCSLSCRFLWMRPPQSGREII